jgi:hypothetical protein
MEAVLSKSDILSSRLKPQMPEVDPANIPDTLKNSSRWVGWEYRRRKDKWNKIPIDAKTGGPGSSTNVQTWTDWETAWPAYQDGKIGGVGIVLGDGLIGIDLDDCRNVDTAELSPLALEIISTLNSYTEVSPSGTGVKIIVCGELPEKHRTKNKAGTVEVYSDGRYFTLTGDVVGQHDVEHRQTELFTVWEKFINSERQAPAKVRSKSAPSKELGTSNPYLAVNDAPLEAILRNPPRGPETDGSKRMFIWCCRIVGHDLSDEHGIALVREAAKTHPFPQEWSDDEIIARIRQAESKVVRGSELVIRCDHDVSRVIGEAINAMANHPIYQNPAGILTRYEPTPERCKASLHDNGSPRLGLIPQASMIEVLSDVARWESFNIQNGQWSRVFPPKDIQAAIHGRREFPGVKIAYGVVSSPVLLPDGEIIKTPGYNADAGLILNIDGEWPELMDNDTAKAKLFDAWCDFPFAEPSHRSAALAALLTLLCRNIIPGNAPFFPFDGNTPGCGKGLLTDTLTVIAENRRASRYVYSSDQNELRKYLTSLAVAGRNYILFDNVKDRFGGAVLEAAMTTGTISDRILGGNKTVELPLQLVWLATCNGMFYTNDMLRRSVPIMLDSPDLNPQLRDDFKHPRLLEHVTKNRRELLIAGLSIVANYIKEGKPDQGLSAFGGFEAWSDLIRSAVVFAGEPDPCGHCQTLYAEIEDTTIGETAELLNAWTFNGPITTANVVKAVNENPAAFPALNALLELKQSGTTDAEHLGKLLRSARGKVIGGRCLDKNNKKRAEWFIKSAH